MTQAADILLRSSAIFTATAPAPFAGFVAVAGNTILAVGEGDGSDYADTHTRIFDLGDKLVSPGFADVHCFFTGYLLTQAGADLSAAQTPQQALELVRTDPAGRIANGTVLGRSLPAALAVDEALLNDAFGETPAILFVEDGETCRMNTAARTAYSFSPETCWSESYWKLLRALLQDRALSVPMLRSYLAMLNRRGITSVKEMGFDDFYGFADVLEELEHTGQLPMRVHFMSQPVGAPLNLAHGRAMRSRFTGDFVRFSGYNQMTDGSISQLEGEMKAPYLCADTCCAKQIDWEGLAADTRAVDAEDFRFSLHAQGDGAIAKVLDIYETCKRGADGKVQNRHAITDLECSDPADLERMGKLGVVAEIYPQIMSIADRAGKLAMIAEKIGTARGANYWNRRKMADSGVVLSCGTDLPLLVDDIPQSVYHAVGALFPEGGEPFNAQNTLTVSELLTAWTRGGQYNLMRDDALGTLEPGKLADIAVLDTNLFVTPPQQARSARVCLTLVNGAVVWQDL